MQVSEVALTDISDRLRGEWLELSRASGPGAFFSSPAFVEAFATVFASRERLSVMTLRDRAGGLVGLMPLCRSRVRRGPSLATRYAYIESDYEFLRDRPKWLPFTVSQLSSPLSLEATALRSEPLALPERRTDVLRGLAKAIAASPGWHVGIFALEEPEARIMACGREARTQIHQLERPLRHLVDPCPIDELLAARDKKFRNNGRRARRICAEAGVVFGTAVGRDAVEPLLTDFADVAARSWKQSDTSERAESEVVLVPYTARQRRLAEELVASPELEPILFTARLDGRLLAAMLAFRFGTVMTTLLLYTDATAGRLSAGRLVLHNAIDHAAALGLSAIDWNSNASWTEKYSNHVSVRNNLLIVNGGIYESVLMLLSKARQLYAWRPGTTSASAAPRPFARSAPSARSGT